MTEKEALISLCGFVPFGPARIKLLIEYFGSAKRVWNTHDKNLKELGLSEKLISEFINFRNKFNYEQYFKQVKNLGINILTINDKNYPQKLREISDAPIVLNIKGDIKPEDEVAIAIVGSRKVTGYGKEMARKFAQELAGAGVTVISGLALGVDGVAHEAAVEAGGRTLAVLGSGLDKIYPPTHLGLARRVSQNGALVSEYPLGHEALPFNFPYRNRIISGMSLGVLVIEGTEKSGTLLTASHAASQGREVFAVPGPVTSPNSGAPNLLIKQGAKVVTKTEDILEEFNIKNQKLKIKNREVLPETEEEKLIFQLIERENLHVDEIIRRVEMNGGLVLSTLTTMELKGMVKNFGGGIYGKM